MAFETFEITQGIEESRPTLPPLHTLNLPFPSSRPTYDNLLYTHLNLQRDYMNTHSRRLSASSSCTSPSESGALSRTASPSPSDVSSSSTSQTKFRLEPCPLDKADAVILVPPPSTTDRQSESADLSITKTKTPSQPLFLVGPALHQFRHSERSRPLAKGARVHPYRIVRNSGKGQTHHQRENDARRSATVSLMALTHIKSLSPRPGVVSP